MNILFLFQKTGRCICTAGLLVDRLACSVECYCGNAHCGFKASKIGAWGKLCHMLTHLHVPLYISNAASCSMDRISNIDALSTALPLAPLLALLCSLRSRAPLRSFVCSLVQSLAPVQMGKRFLTMNPMAMRRLHIISTHCSQKIACS